MTDTGALKNKIAASGYKLEYVANVVGISRHALHKKITNANEFKTGEVKKLCELLGITDPEERDHIFFA